VREGLLWFDNDPKRNPVEKIGRAARRYREKYGVPPEVCYVHPAVITAMRPSSGEPKEAVAIEDLPGLQVASLPWVLQHHFWVVREADA
jgi:hypothetical protein